ncbi:MAG: Gfo/Idh/MocA family oxidoreductase [Planctomycetes bacterium]|nr:Gfo/Idh/MocA family oxidoreductase [Planctomycetota bacterium]
MVHALSLAILGTGFLARTRARCWARVHGGPVQILVASRERARAVAFAAQHPGVVPMELEQVFADRAVQLVDVCVPNHRHRELCERAAQAGKAVLCTKPLAAWHGQELPEGADPAQFDRLAMLRLAVAEAEAMVQACRAARVPLFYGENWLFAPAVQRAAALSAASGGMLLEMRGGESHSGSHAAYARDWRTAGGGALLRLGAHAIGAMLWLKHREGLRLCGAPTRLVAVAGEVADLSAAARAAGVPSDLAQGWNGVENWGSCVLHFSDGTRGVAFGSDNLLGGMESRLSLFGSNHRLECSLSPHDQVRAYAVREGGFGGEYLMEKLHGQAGWSTPLPDEDWSSGQQGLVQAVADALRSDRTLDADGALGVAVVRAVYAAYCSAASGQRVAVG